MKEDFSVWFSFMEQFNGHSLWQRDFVLVQELQLFTDAAGSLGFGAFFDGRWCAGPWHSSWVENKVTRNVVLLKLFPVVVSLVLWGRGFSDRRILLHTDNKGVLFMVNCLLSKCPLVVNICFLVFSSPSFVNCFCGGQSRRKVPG